MTALKVLSPAEIYFTVMLSPADNDLTLRLAGIRILSPFEISFTVIRVAFGMIALKILSLVVNRLADVPVTFSVPAVFSI